MISALGAARGADLRRDLRRGRRSGTRTRAGGLRHAAVVEIDPDACETLRINRGSRWKIIEADVADVNGAEFRGADLLAGGVPCPPFSVAGSSARCRR